MLGSTHLFTFGLQFGSLHPPSVWVGPSAKQPLLCIATKLRATNPKHFREQKEAGGFGSHLSSILWRMAGKLMRHQDHLKDREIICNHKISCGQYLKINPQL